MKFSAVLCLCILFAAAPPAASAQNGTADDELFDESGETITQEFNTPWRDDDSLPTQREWRRLNRRGVRKPHRNEDSQRREESGSVLGAEGTPNIPGAAGTPNIPGAGTLVSPTHPLR